MDINLKLIVCSNCNRFVPYCNGECAHIKGCNIIAEWKKLINIIDRKEESV